MWITLEELREEHRPHAQVEFYLRQYFDHVDFCKHFTRKELADMCRTLFPHTVKQSRYAFCSCCKKRMVEHLAFYKQLHGLKEMNLSERDVEHYKSLGVKIEL